MEDSHKYFENDAEPQVNFTSEKSTGINADNVLQPNINSEKCSFSLLSHSHFHFSHILAHNYPVLQPDHPVSIRSMPFLMRDHHDRLPVFRIELLEQVQDFL